VASALVQVGRDGDQLVTLLLCEDCLALELTLPCGAPPLAITYLD
jgi:hypothetical protein